MSENSSKFAPPDGWKAEIARWALRQGPGYLLAFAILWRLDGYLTSGVPVAWLAYREDTQAVATALNNLAKASETASGSFDRGICEMCVKLDKATDEMRETNRAVSRGLSALHFGGNFSTKSEHSTPTASRKEDK